MFTQAVQLQLTDRGLDLNQLIKAADRPQTKALSPASAETYALEETAQTRRPDLSPETENKLDVQSSPCATGQVKSVIAKFEQHQQPSKGGIGSESHKRVSTSTVVHRWSIPVRQSNVPTDHSEVMHSIRVAEPLKTSSKGPDSNSASAAADHVQSGIVAEAESPPGSEPTPTCRS